MTAYCDRVNVEVMFGALNIRRWADLDNTENEVTIHARIDWACELATEYVNSRLVRGHYTIPFTSIPVMIVNLTAMYAGIMLYDGRQVVSSDDKDVVSRQRKDFDRYIRQIVKGQLKLLDPVTGAPLVLTDYNAPSVVADTGGDDEEAEWETMIF